ncbi:MAG: transposase [Candidatus Omnitrophica bacterium]|jgi:putative transposase|nr:transposase [Candidatus Omnitrophota bacterium]
MKMRSYRLELKLNQGQRVLCSKSAGTSRFAYNWKLDKLIGEYEANKALATMYGLNKIPSTFGSAIDWHKDWVLLKQELPWIRETSKCCGQEALRDLQLAFQRFFSKKSGYPKFKKRGQRDSFRISSNVYVLNNYVQIAGIGKIRLKEKNYPILEGKCLLSQATVSRQCDGWYVSFLLPETVEDPVMASIESIEECDILGVDLGIKELAITSEGETFENPKAYKKHLAKLKRYQRMVSRRAKGSKNKQKAITKLSRVHKRVADIRNDTVHKLTTSLVRTKPKVIVIETLKPKNMSKNHKLASAVLDSSFGKIKDTLKYKCAWNGIHLIMAPTFYASSKYCSICGHKHNDLKLSDREWTCSSCGTHLDRDVNAAKNLQYLGLWMVDKHSPSGESSVSSTQSYACGDERLQFLLEQCSSMKQEFKSQNQTLHLECEPQGEHSFA